jgi:hypothetical protein
MHTLALPKFLAPRRKLQLRRPRTKRLVIFSQLRKRYSTRHGQIEVLHSDRLRKSKKESV